MLSHADHVDFAQGVSCLQRHHVVQSLRHDDLLIVVSAHLLEFIGRLQVRRHIAGVYLGLGADGTLNGPAHVQRKRESGLGCSAVLGEDLRFLVVLLQVLRASHLGHYLDGRDEALVGELGALLQQLLVLFVVAVVNRWQHPREHVALSLGLVSGAVPLGSTCVKNMHDLVQELAALLLHNIRHKHIVLQPNDHEDDVVATTGNHDTE